MRHDIGIQVKSVIVLGPHGPVLAEAVRHDLVHEIRAHSHRKKDRFRSRIDIYFTIAEDSKIIF